MRGIAGRSLAHPQYLRCRAPDPWLAFLRIASPARARRIATTSCLSPLSAWRIAPSRSTRPAAFLAHDRAVPRLAHPAAKLPHRPIRACDRYRLRVLLEHALSLPVAPAFEAQAGMDFANPDRPPSPSRRSALHRVIAPQLQNLRAQLPRPNLPRERLERPRPLSAQPIDVASPRNEAPTYCTFHEDRAMQAECAPRNTFMKTRRCTPVQANACGSEPEPLDRPVQAERYNAYTRIWRASSCSFSRP